MAGKYYIRYINREKLFFHWVFYIPYIHLAVYICLHKEERKPLYTHIWVSVHAHTHKDKFFKSGVIVVLYLLQKCIFIIYLQFQHHQPLNCSLDCDLFAPTLCLFFMMGDFPLWITMELTPKMISCDVSFLAPDTMYINYCHVMLNYVSPAVIIMKWRCGYARWYHLICQKLINFTLAGDRMSRPRVYLSVHCICKTWGSVLSHCSFTICFSYWQRKKRALWGSL